VNHVAFSPDGRRLVVSWGGAPRIIGAATIWELDAAGAIPSRRELTHGDDVLQAAFHPGGQQILTASYDRTSRLWDAASGQPLEGPRSHPLYVVQCAFSPDGRRSLTVNGNETRVRDEATGASILLKHEGSVLYAAFGAESNRVVTSGVDHEVRVWDAATGSLVVPPLVHNGRVAMAAMSPDGRHLVTVCADQKARVWDLACGLRPARSLRHGTAVISAALSPDGLRLLTTSRGGDCRLWNLADGAQLGPPMRHQGFMNDGTFSPDGLLAVTVDALGDAHVFDGRTATPLAVVADSDRDAEGSPAARHAVFDGAGAHMLCYGTRGARLWQWRTGRVLAQFVHDPDVEIVHAAFGVGHSGGLVATAGGDGRARLWHRDGTSAGPPLVHQGRVTFLAFSPQGDRLVTTSSDGSGRLWNVAHGSLIAVLPHDQAVTHAAFSPDGRSVATASDDRTARLWSATDGTALTPLLHHEHLVVRVAFSASGRLLATGSGEGLMGSTGQARVWEAATGNALTPPLVHGNRVSSIAFTPDELRLITASVRDPAARVWEIAPAGGPREELERLAVCITGARVDPVGGLRTVDAEAYAATTAGGAHPAAASRAELQAWHESEAFAAVDARTWEGALRHYDALVSEATSDYTFPVLRARARLESGDRTGARDDLLAAIRLGSDDYYAWNAAALLALATGDLAAYRGLCRDVVGRFGALAIPKYQDALADLCTLGPDALPARNEVVAMAKRSVQRTPGSPYALATLGAAHYRAGQFEEAISRLLEAIEAQKAGGTVETWLLLALCHRRLGREREASAWMTRVEAHARSALPNPAYDPVWGALSPVFTEFLQGEFHRIPVSDPPDSAQKDLP
jgi:WD40 repeat protein/tetratricopeptide (TPR) repeat protein